MKPIAQTRTKNTDALRCELVQLKLCTVVRSWNPILRLISDAEFTGCGRGKVVESKVKMVHYPKVTININIIIISYHRPAYN